MSDARQRKLRFVRRLGSAVASQALLSAASFAIGLLLIRHTSDVAYGSYVLAAGAILLLVSLQRAFVAPVLAVRGASLEPVQRARLVGGLYVAQSWGYVAGAVLLGAVVLALWLASVLAPEPALLLAVTLLALAPILHREYFRVVLFVHGRPQPVFAGDLVYAVVAFAAVLLAIGSGASAAGTVGALGLGGAASALLLLRATQRTEAWTARRAPGLLREIAPLAAWSTAGAAIHWTFSQGYVYLVAAALDVASVAALAATRLLLMPVNLLSAGIGSLMLPLAAGWFQRHGEALLLRRLYSLALAMATLTLAYFGLLWIGRDWVFDELLRKSFAQRDALLLWWGAIFLVMGLRDQLAYALSAQGRFRDLTLLTSGCAVLSLLASYAGMVRLGVTGALAGMLAGEVASLLGIVVLSRWRSTPPLAPA